MLGGGGDGIIERTRTKARKKKEGALAREVVEDVEGAGRLDDGAGARGRRFYLGVVLDLGVVFGCGMP